MARAEELTVLVATLTERLDNTRRDIETITVRCTKSEDGFGEIKTKLAVVDERLTELKRGLEEASRRKAAILPPLIAGVVGGILAVLGQFMIRQFFD